jgi:hypothetical protein
VCELEASTKVKWRASSKGRRSRSANALISAEQKASSRSRNKVCEELQATSVGMFNSCI